MKRLLTRFLLMTMLVMGVTTAWAQKSVLDESFADGLPKGWTQAKKFWKFEDGNASFMALAENNGADTLFSPMVSLSELDNVPSVAFAYSLLKNGDKVNELKVLYRASSGDAWSELQAFAEATDGQMKWKGALPESLTKVQIAIAGAYKLGGETRVYRLAVENKTEAADAPAGLKTENLKTTSVDLWWDASASSKFVQYNLKVSSSPMTDLTLMADVLDYVDKGLTDEWYNLAGLQPNTAYWFYVQYDCGFGDVSPWAEFSFRTQCASIGAPYSENFEGELSNCYVVEGAGTHEVSGEYAYNSQKSFKSISAKGAYNYLILPELNNEANRYQISFMAAAIESGNTYARTVSVGVCESPAGEAFSAVSILNLPKGRVWEPITVSLKGYSGKGKYIALRLGNEDKINHLFIDNIKVEVAQECPKPMFVQVSEITPTAAKLSWTKGGGETEWNLVLSTKYLTDPEDIEPDEAKGEYAGSISANPYTATNLQSNTTYYAYLQAACGSSEWTSAVEFKTPRPVSYPYSEHFDRMSPSAYTNNTAAIPDGWVFDDRGNNPSYASYYDKQNTSDSYRPYVTTAQNNEQTAYVNASLYLRGTGVSSSTSTGYTSIAMMPAMPKAVNTMMVTFWAKATGGNHTLKVGVANTQTNDLPQGQQLGANITEVGEATIIKDEWKQYKVLLTNYTGEGRYITFYMKPGTSTPYIYIDDIEVDEAPDCNAVSTLSATATGIDKATAEWTDASSSKSWIIKVSSSEIDPSSANGDIVASKTVSAKSYDITGLSMGKTYYVYVSPTCGDAWMSTTVTTLVGLQVPYYNDFQNENAGSNATRGPKNWTLGNINVTAAIGTQTNIPYVYNTAMTGAPAGVEKPSLYIQHGSTATVTGAYAIMPELLNADMKDLKMSFYGYWNNADPSNATNYACVKGSYYGALKVGVVEKLSDINKTDKFDKVTVIKNISCKAPKTVESFVVDFSAYSGSGKYIVFYSDTAKYDYFMIDNLSITLASAPQPVSDVAASEMTQTGAKLTWTENGQATKWEVRVFDAPQDDPVEGNPVFAEFVETTSEDIINSLKHSTQYYAYVRSVQGEEVGAWGSTSFFTECGAWAVPFTEDWNSYATGANTLTPCYTQTANAAVAAESILNLATENRKGGNVIKFNATSSVKNPTLVFPTLDKPINTLQLTMKANPYSDSYAGKGSYTEIGVMEGETFVKVADYMFDAADKKNWQEVFVNFGSYTGEGGRIAIRCPYDAVNTAIHVGFDDILIEQIPQCGRITSIDVTEIDSVSAKISWEKGKTENKWNLKVSSTAMDDPSAATADVFDGALTEQTKALADLEGNTTYYVYVQSVDEVLECEGQWSNAKTFKTTCKKQTFPYEEDFESYETGAGKDMGCMMQCGDDKGSYITTKGTGNKALWLRQVTKDHNNYFVFPALAIDSVKRLQLSMQVYVGTTATYTYPFEVGVMTDPNDPSTFVATHNEALAGQSAAYDRSYTFEGYAGDETGTKFGTFIALKPLNYKNATGSEYANNAIYIDNVYIDFIETCPAATDLKTDSVGTYGAKFIWNTDDKTAAHRVRIFDDATAKPNDDTFVKEIVVKDSTAIIEGLQALTKYYAFVRKECGANDLSKWSSAFAFKTGCPETRAIPYEEGFDGDTDPLADYCWSSIMIQTVSNCTSDYNSKSSTSAKKDGTRGLYLQYTEVPSQSGGSCVGTHRSAAITPALEVESLKDLVVYFDVRRSGSTNAGLKIEAVSDDTKDADAIYITTINDITADWSKAYVKLADYYTSVQAYKRLRFSTTTASGIYIDNLVITNNLNTILPVEALKVTMLTESTIKFSFVESTPTVKQWQVAYVTAGGDIADATVKTIDETEYTIEGLAANTSYDIYVRGNVDGDAWVGPLTATTIQDPALLPYSTGFEDDANKWVIYSAKNVQGDPYPNYFIVGAADKCGATGQKALFITNDSSSYAYHTKDAQGEIGFSNAWATRNIKIEAAGTYKFKFKVKVPANKDNESDYATAHLFPAGATILGENATLLNGTIRKGTAVTDVPANNIYSLMGKTFHEKEWIWVSKSLDVEEAGIYTLAVFWYNASVGAQYGEAIAVDSVIVEEYFCTTPKNFELKNRTATEVSIEWFGGKCKNFEYVVSEYKNLGNPSLIDPEDKVAYGMINDGPAVTLSRLAPTTDYSLYVRTICEDGMTDWVEYDFNTPCAKEELPYTQAFFETPECWTLSAASVTTQKYKTSDMTEAEVWSCLQLSKGGLAILPELNVPMNKVQIDLEVFNTTNLGAVSIGVMDNTWDPSTFKEVKLCQTQYKLTSSSSAGNPLVLEPFSHMFNLYKGNGKVLAIKNATDNAIYVKDVKLTELPDCVRPQQVELTFVTDNSITVNWIAGIEEAWEIKINDQIIENVTTNPYKITGLEQGTVYEIAVRAICDEEDTSEWSVPAKVQTQCSANPLPLFEDFSSLKSGNQRATMTCWANMATDYPIEQVFSGTIRPYEPASNVYYTYMWIANYLTQLGDAHQLLFFGSTLLNSGPKYRWMITPQYAIEGKALLSFDVKHVDNKNMAAKPTGRFFVAISTDNGDTWKKADATVIEGIDSVYSTKSVSLDKYAGQNIRVAFYMENLGGETTTKGSGLFTLLDNIRINCAETYNISDGACQGYDYENNGFKIAKEDLPILGKDSTYTRFASNSENGCDSTINLTLTTHAPADIAPVYATICQGEYYEFGTWKLDKPAQEEIGEDYYYIRGVNQYGCDSTIRLYLTVNPSDTTIVPGVIEKLNSELPFKVDDYYTIPADAPIGTDTVFVKKGESCSFNRYYINISRCEVANTVYDTICADQTEYAAYNFAIPSDKYPKLPAVSTTKVYRDTIRTAQGCDSVVKLELTVLPNETIDVVREVYNDQLPYKVDEYYTVSKKAAIGVQDPVIVPTVGCSCNRYLITVLQCTRVSNFETEICETEVSYSDYGFDIEKADLPAVNNFKTYTKHVPTAAGCDSVVNLKLTVNKADTISFTATVLNNELPYIVDNEVIVPAGAAIGVQPAVVLSSGYCQFTKYIITVEQCKKQSDLLEDEICEDADGYYANGFEIAKAQFPAVNSFKTFERHELTLEGCDSLISLKLTVHKADTLHEVKTVLNNELPYMDGNVEIIPAGAAFGPQPVVLKKIGDCQYKEYIITVEQCQAEPKTLYASICENAESYEGNGFEISKADFPAVTFAKKFERHETTAEGCDSLITLNLTVNKADTAVFTDEILNNELPYMVGNDTIVPVDAALGVQPAVVIETADCKYTKYIITVNQCQAEPKMLEASICELADGYYENGFEIAKADMPAANSYKNFKRNETTAAGCDSLITLKLIVNKADTAVITDEILNNALPYMAGNVEIVPVGADLGVQPAVVLETGDCKFAKYIITVEQCKKESEVLKDTICELADGYYENNFEIAKDELPAANLTKKFERHELTAEGCDSLITLMLTVKNDTTKIPVSLLITDLPYQVDEYYTVPADAPVDEQFIVTKQIGDEGCSYNRYIVMVSACAAQETHSASICQNTDSYEGYGFTIAANEYPVPGETKQFYRNEAAGEGCIHVTLNLTVNKADTAVITDEILNNALPYMAGNVEIIPVGATIGEQPAVVIETGDCQYTKYIITVNQCQAEPKSLEASICELADGYYENGFEITKAQMPAVNSFQIFTRHETTVEGCDSLISLKLTVDQADTALVTAKVLNNALPYMVGNDTIVPVGAALGEQPAVVLQTGDCQFTKYIITVNQCQAEPMSLYASICELADGYYENGFEIAKAELPVVNSYKDFTRHETTVEGCDSLITLRLTVNKADTSLYTFEVMNNELPYKVDEFYTVPAGAAIGLQPDTILKTGECEFTKYVITVIQCTKQSETILASICETADGYYENGFEIAKADMPAVNSFKYYSRNELTVEGCDSLITLRLTVNKADTNMYISEVLNNQLPYIVDEFYTVPADAAIGLQPDTVLMTGDCQFTKYIITVNQCQAEPMSFGVSICETADGYYENGFEIAKADMPAANSYKDFTRHETTVAGCDSLITLRLTVNKADTAYVVDSILNSELPYMVEDKVIVPAGAAIGAQPRVTLPNGDCSFISYDITVQQCELAIEFQDSICAGSASEYANFGFFISEADMPAPGKSLNYMRTNRSEEGCDSTIVLTLKMMKNDTTGYAIEVYENELPYTVDTFFTIPADKQIGTYVEVVGLDNCKYNRYTYTVKACIVEADPIYDNVCVGLDYAGYGFEIKAAEMPAVGEKKEFYRRVQSEIACDSLYTLILTVHNPDTITIAQTVTNVELPFVDGLDTIVPAGAAIGVQPEVILKSGECEYTKYIITVKKCEASIFIDDNVCRGIDYADNGFVIKADSLPAPGQSKDFMRQILHEDGCDTLITLSLYVTDYDTTNIARIVTTSELPYEVDEYYTVPATAQAGDTIIEVVQTDICEFNRYIVYVTECAAEETLFADSICAGENGYNGYGFEIAADKLPAPGNFDYFTRIEKTAQNCDSVIILTLTVMPKDTFFMDPIEIFTDELPYQVDEFYTVPADTEVGEYIEVIQIDECSYNSYAISVLERPHGIINISDEVNYIDVYDAVGRKVATLRQGETPQDLPTGVYMLRTVMKSGKMLNSKVTLQ